MFLFVSWLLPSQKTQPWGCLYHPVQSLLTLCVLEKTSLMKDSCKRQVKRSSPFPQKLRDLHGQINGCSSYQLTADLLPFCCGKNGSCSSPLSSCSPTTPTLAQEGLCSWPGKGERASRGQAHQPPWQAGKGNWSVPRVGAHSGNAG